MKKVISWFAPVCLLAAAACGKKAARQSVAPAPPVVSVAPAVSTPPAAGNAPRPATISAAPRPVPAPTPPAPPPGLPPLPAPPLPVPPNGAAQVSSSAGLLPSVQSSDPGLAIANPRWGAGIRSLEFDVTYAGQSPTADCDYRLLDAAGNAAGMTGSFQVRAGEQATQSIQVGDNVTAVRISVR